MPPQRLSTADLDLQPPRRSKQPLLPQNLGIGDPRPLHMRVRPLHMRVHERLGLTKKQKFQLPDVHQNKELPPLFRFCRLAKQHVSRLPFTNAVSFQKWRFDVFTKVAKLAVSKIRRLVGGSRRLVRKSRRFKTLTWQPWHNTFQCKTCFKTE